VHYEQGLRRCRSQREVYVSPRRDEQDILQNVLEVENGGVPAGMFYKPQRVRAARVYLTGRALSNKGDAPPTTIGICAVAEAHPPPPPSQNMALAFFGG
jgi:hypothetical protein